MSRLIDSAVPELSGYLRADGRKGIRNVVAVAYTVECAHHVSREIVQKFHDQLGTEVEVHLIGFSGCFANAFAEGLMEKLLTHPNVGATLLVSLGCEGMNKNRLARAVEASGRPTQVLTIQESGGTRKTVAQGVEWVRWAVEALRQQERVPMAMSELVVATKCGGSDGSSGLTGNPAVGHCYDRLVAAGAACMFEETGELIGCEYHMRDRAVTPELGEALVQSVARAARFFEAMGHGSFAPGNADGGLTTIEEKSLGAYAKSGTGPISGILRPGEAPPHGGLYLIDIVPDSAPRFGFPNPVDTAELVEMMATGAHMTLFTTGRGSVIGCALAPVIKVCANPETYRRMEDDMDVDAGRILEGRGTLAEVGREIFDQVVRVARGGLTKSEELGHREFVLAYKSLEPLGPACMPIRAA